MTDEDRSGGYCFAPDPICQVCGQDTLEDISHCTAVQTGKCLKCKNCHADNVQRWLVTDLAFWNHPELLDTSDTEEAMRKHGLADYVPKERNPWVHIVVPAKHRTKHE